MGTFTKSHYATRRQHFSSGAGVEHAPTIITTQIRKTPRSIVNNKNAPFAIHAKGAFFKFLVALEITIGTSYLGSVDFVWSQSKYDLRHDATRH